MNTITLSHHFYNEVKSVLANYNAGEHVATLLSKAEKNYGKDTAELIAKILKKRGISSEDLYRRFDELFICGDLIAVLRNYTYERNQLIGQLQKALCEKHCGSGLNE